MTDTPRPLTDLLREATMPDHQLTERLSPIWSILNQGCPLGLYTGFLGQMLSFYRPIEQHLLKFIKTYGVDYVYTQKSSLLAEDIASLTESGATCLEISDRLILPESWDRNVFLGVLYVLEGATLGGTVMRKALCPYLSTGHRATSKFWDPYGADTRAHWAHTCEFINREAMRHDVAPDTVVDHAKLTFLRFRECVNVP